MELEFSRSFTDLIILSLRGLCLREITVPLVAVDEVGLMVFVVISNE